MKPKTIKNPTRVRQFHKSIESVRYLIIVDHQWRQFRQANFDISPGVVVLCVFFSFCFYNQNYNYYSCIRSMNTFQSSLRLKEFQANNQHQQQPAEIKIYTVIQKKRGKKLEFKEIHVKSKIKKQFDQILSFIPKSSKSNSALFRLFGA